MKSKSSFYPQLAFKRTTGLSVFVKSTVTSHNVTKTCFCFCCLEEESFIKESQDFFI